MPKLEFKVLNHPDREEIIKLLLDGVAALTIHEMLKERYPGDIEKNITTSSISDFRREYLNIDKTSANMLRREHRKMKQEKANADNGLPHNPNVSTLAFIANETEQQLQARTRETLLSTPTYQEKLRLITDAHLDAPRLMKELHSLLQSRIEVYYNEIASASGVAETLKADKMFVDYVRLATDVLKDARKVWEDYNATANEENIDLNVVHEMIGIVREAIKESMNEFGPDLALEFMDRLNKKFASMNYHVPKPPKNILERVEGLKSRIDNKKPNISSVPRE